MYLPVSYFYLTVNFYFDSTFLFFLFFLLPHFSILRLFLIDNHSSLLMSLWWIQRKHRSFPQCDYVYSIDGAKMKRTERKERRKKKTENRYERFIRTVSHNHNFIRKNFFSSFLSHFSLTSKHFPLFISLVKLEHISSIFTHSQIHTWQLPYFICLKFALNRTRERANEWKKDGERERISWTEKL